MKLDDLKKKQIVTGDGHFMPVVFVDMSIPTAMIGAGATLAARELNKQLKDNIITLPKSAGNNLPYKSICAETADMKILALSIDDIAF